MTVPVTCVITCFNDAKTLGATVRSVLDQTMPVSEIILADDASSDGTRGLILALAQTYNVVIPLLRDRNVGVAANRDLAIRSASQPFVTYLDGDDFFAKGKIEAEWAALREQHDAVAYSNIARVWPEKLWWTHVHDPSETVRSRTLAFHRLATRKGAIPRDLLISKSLFEAVGGFTHGVPLLEDWEFKMRLAQQKVKWVHSGALGTVYIQNGKGLSNASLAEYQDWSAKALISVGAEVKLPKYGKCQDGALGFLTRIPQRLRRLKETVQAIKYHSEIRELI